MSHGGAENNGQLGMQDPHGGGLEMPHGGVPHGVPHGGVPHGGVPHGGDFGIGMQGGVPQGGVGNGVAPPVQGDSNRRSLDRNQLGSNINLLAQRLEGANDKTVDVIKILSLSNQALIMGSKWKGFCNCKGGCKHDTCGCRMQGVSCTSKCHSGSQCENK